MQRDRQCNVSLLQNPIFYLLLFNGITVLIDHGLKTYVGTFWKISDNHNRTIRFWIGACCSEWCVVVCGVVFQFIIINCSKYI